MVELRSVLCQKATVARPGLRAEFDAQQRLTVVEFNSSAEKTASPAGE